MLYFLENHDEQRIASDFFAGEPRKAIPGMLVTALLYQNPVMVYAGQEFGERGMDKEGFSGCDGRSTIFDYWTVESVYKGFWNKKQLTNETKSLLLTYQRILNICNNEAAVREGQSYDLMYVNVQSDKFNSHRQFAFLRKAEDEVLLIVANFSKDKKYIGVTIPSHAFEFLGLSTGNVVMTDLLSGDSLSATLEPNKQVEMEVDGYYGRVYKFMIKK